MVSEKDCEKFIDSLTDEKVRLNAIKHFINKARGQESLICH
jgi:hypothetical protein